jgi:isopenicillin N synthase-like dioxygenase
MVQIIKDGAIGGFADFENRSRVALKKLPVIDFSPFSAGGSDEDRRRVGRELHEVCRDIGFFYLSNHGIPNDLMQRVLDLGLKFFELPAEEKMKLHQKHHPGHKGYVGVGGESPETNPDKGVDLKERFLMNRQPIPGESREGIAHPGADVWPGDRLVPGFEATMKDYMGRMVTLAQQMARAFALSLELPQSHFDEMFRYLDGVMPINYYPPLNEAEVERNQWSFSPHSDYGAFTLLLQDSLGGLQARNSDGQWIEIPPIADTFVVNLGDLFAMWTNDIYVSTLHRAANVSNRARVSVPFFCSPHGMTRIECLATCTTPDNPPRHEPVLSGEYLRALIAQSNRTGRAGLSKTTAERFRKS